MVPAQCHPHVLQANKGRSRQHSRLPHPATQQLPHAPGLSDKVPGSSQHCTSRGAQALPRHRGVTRAAPAGMCPGTPQPANWVLSPVPPKRGKAPVSTLEKQRDTESQCWVIRAGSTFCATAAFISRAPSMCTRIP